MIDVIKQTPAEYSKQSRDYQVISRLYTALFNLNKMYIDNLNVWNSNIDNKLTLLRSKTLNFDPKHSWDLNSLEGVVSSFKYLMRNKGTAIAIKYCTTILMRINGMSGACETSVRDNNILIKVPNNLSSIGVLKDLFDYIIPAGMTYRVIEYTLVDTGEGTKVKYSDSITNTTIADINMGIYFDRDDNSTEPPEEVIYSGKYVGNQGNTIYHNIVGDPDQR